MSFARLLTLFVGLSLILGLGIWLITSLYRLYLQISFTSPFLANFLLLFLVILLGLLIFAFIYYFNFYNNKKSRTKVRRNRLVKKIPEEKTQAAAENLKALKKQVGQIQDRIAQEAFLKRSEEIEANLARGEIKIVVFGTGSAGKTSLVNSLMGEIVGEVNPTMGTTKEGETYSLKLKGIAREILITDTPGILEAGIAGTERGELARQLATEADLLLFVVDNDLLQSEYEPLKTLAEIGKRSLLVFNKIDLYADEDQEVILKQLKERVTKLIPAADVIAIAANPQPVQLASGEIIEPEPEIIPLIKRLVAVLRAEGEDLIADNILLQSQRLGDQARKIIDRQRKRQAERVIDRYQWIGAGVIAMTPLPVVDLLATAAVNAQMVVEIGRIYGCELNSDRGRDLALSLGKTLVSLGVVKGAVEILAKALQFHVATYIVGKVIQAVSAAYLTRIAGKSFIEYFRHDQDWGDGGITEVVQRQFQLSRRDEFVKSFVKDAIAKVVQPLTGNWEEQEPETLELEARLEDDW
ncbi:small GTP-binding protein [Stanieria cyanosphaera PCC 7437]|uniref:Small GTP-binding protein n=1 Tax=Stanieria cyanosphaera (strain ATCC 29371 / PCC 7437) TaxID=111780 RepID=K9XTE7_STAC7|nr:GTP-binding protein [Stanieria cyanosphaera]AFZ35808.1 small GTP-binding protein [Stanieria cyanosphaera PCC 7437]